MINQVPKNVFPVNIRKNHTNLPLDHRALLKLSVTSYWSLLKVGSEGDSEVWVGLCGGQWALSDGGVEGRNANYESGPRRGGGGDATRRR